jgi:uncharacterized iron-regulated membrane protein
MAIEPLQNEVAPRGLDHRTVWRWHFYAGLFCIPFVLWLSVTGTIFLFHPQIQHYLDRPYDHLAIEQRASANAQVQAALAAVPGTTLDSYQLPSTSSSAAEVLVDKGSEQFRVYVHPQTLAILRIDNEDHRVDTFTSRLHGELLMGKYGSWIIELAGSWAVVMIVTALFLWWPSDTKGLGGVLYPRLGLNGRAFWKDIHSVVGIYVSVLALFLLFTGLPWAKSWGGYLKAIRHFSAGHAVTQDWTTTSAQVLAARQARSTMAMEDMQGMSGMHSMENMPGTLRPFSGCRGGLALGHLRKFLLFVAGLPCAFLLRRGRFKCAKDDGSGLLNHFQALGEERGIAVIESDVIR